MSNKDVTQVKMLMPEAWGLFKSSVVDRSFSPGEVRNIIATMTRDAFFAGANTMLGQVMLCAVLAGEEGSAHMTALEKGMQDFINETVARMAAAVKAKKGGG